MIKIALVLFLSLFLTMPGFAAEYKGADLPATIHTLAKNAGLYAIINEEVKGKVYMTIPPEATMAELMDKLSEAYDLNWQIEEGYLIVTPAAINTHSKVFTVKFANLKQLKADLNAFLPDAKVTINPEYSTITVDGMPWQIKKAAKKILETDHPIQQIMIQAQMVEINKSDSEKLGFNHTWGTATGTTSNITYAATLNAESVITKGKVLARPVIATLNGLKAELLMGDKVPVVTTQTSSGTSTTSVTYEEVGVKLAVTPRVNGEDSQLITLELAPEVSSITKWVEYDGSKAPQISSREAKTTVRVRSGETIIIGGLIKEEEIKNLSGIPGLKNLPLLGSLFRSKDVTKSQTEVFIFVTPSLLTDQEKTAAPPQEQSQPEMTQPEVVPEPTPAAPVLIEPAPTQQSLKDLAGVVDYAV